MNVPNATTSCARCNTALATCVNARSPTIIHYAGISETIGP